MISNFFTIAWRNLKRQPGYAALNILGLTIGIASALFILLYITRETRYDAYNAHADRIYRIGADITEPDDHFRWSQTQLPLAMQLKESFPEVEEYVRLIPNGRTRLQHGDQVFFEEKAFLADSTLFRVFSYDFLLGDPATALQAPKSIVLCKSLSDRIFGYTNPLGETLKTQSGESYKVTGVYRDMPKYSHLIADCLFSANSIPDLMHPDPGSWGGFGLYNYILLREGADPKAVEAKLPDIIEKYVAVIFNKLNIKIRYEMMPLLDIHLRSDFQGEPEPTGQAGFLYIFGLVALFLVLIACINYMNLATARGIRRALEVGIRKVLGSDKKQLIGQFLLESVLFTAFAVVLSYVLVVVLLPVFDKAFDIELERSLLWSPQVLLGLTGILLVTGILGGSYPAFFLSGFEPNQVLKGSVAKGSGNPNLRKSLVTLQFAITLFMLIGTGVIYDQMNYLRNTDLGFDKEHVLSFNLEGDADRDKFPVLREKLLQNSAIRSVSNSNITPGQGVGKNVMKIETAEGKMDNYGVDVCGIDFDFIPTMGMQMAVGRNFSAEYKTDSSQAVLVNEAMVRRMSWSDPIGRHFQLGSNDTLPKLKVVGVVKDFHQQSLYEPIEPLLFVPRFHNANVHVRLNVKNRQDLNSALAATEKTWQEVFPGTPFEYEFVDAAFMELYAADQVRGRIFSLFGALMILITCLGLLGLASYTAGQRTREIGIRKVLGAEPVELVVLLTRNYLFLVLVAAVPAFIAGWYFMRKWLDTFAFHTQLNYGFFALAFLAIVVITFAATGFHALKVSMVSPSRSLRSE